MYERIIAIVGPPRSGTTWLAQILDSSPITTYRHQPLFSYAFKNRVTKKSDKEEYRQFFADLYESDDTYLYQFERRKTGEYPSFADKETSPPVLVFKMVRYHHLVPDMLKYFESLKCIGIVRHPCGVINSWLSHPNEFPDDANPKKEWRHGECRNKGHPEEYWGFEAWKEVTALYMGLEERYPNQFGIVKYEELVENPIDVTKQLFEFLDLPFTSQTETFLKTSHQRHDRDPYSVYKDKKVKDKWRWQLDEEIQYEILDELRGTKFESFL